MNILSWILFGLITGIIANMLDPEPARGNIFMALVLGVAGAVLGGFLASLILGVSVTGFNLSSFLVAAVGSLAVLVLSRTFRHI